VIRPARRVAHILPASSVFALALRYQAAEHLIDPDAFAVSKTIGGPPSVRGSAESCVKQLTRFG